MTTHERSAPGLLVSCLKKMRFDSPTQLSRSLTWVSVPFAIATLCLVALTGCADNALRSELDAGAAAELRGQTILFVGTDPQTLNTDLYLAQAITQEDVETDGTLDDDDFDISEASEFDVILLTNLAVGNELSPLQDVSDTLFSDQVPFPVPDRLGAYVAILGTTRDDDGIPVAGRVSLMNLDWARTTLGDDIEGLHAVHFTWASSYLVLERSRPDDPSRNELLISSPDAFEDGEEPFSLGPDEPNLSLEFRGLEPGTDRIVALGRDLGTGLSDLYLLSPADGEVVLLTGSPELEDRVGSPTISSDGRWLAMTRVRPETSSRAIVVIDLQAEAPGEPHVLTDDETTDCLWPRWSPAPLEDAELQTDQLVFVCRDRITDRPDVSLWLASDESFQPSVLTDTPQPALFDGTMDGVVIRSEPRWDPHGEFVVFGASTEEDALSGGGITLLVLPIGSTAYSIWTGDEGSAGWEHFSSVSGSRSLLLWDRGETGLNEGPGHYPINIVQADGLGATTRPVELGRPLLVSYPMFLGGNTMLYP